MSNTSLSTGNDESFSTVIIDSVRSGLLCAARDREGVALESAIRRMCDEAHRRGHPPERVALSLNRVWRATTRPGLVGPLDWDDLYCAALSSALAIFYEPVRS